MFDYLHESGQGVRFPRSMLPHPAAERLLVSLGVEIVEDCDAELEDFARAWLAPIPVDVDAPSTRAVRDALARTDEKRAVDVALREVVDGIEKKWCPRCSEWGIAHDRTGLCLWCDGPMQDEPSPDGREEKPPMSTQTQVEPRSRTCKIEGCTSEPLQSHGRYANLCSKHLAERKQSDNAPAAAADQSSTSVRNGVHTANVRALIPKAKALDLAVAKLAKVPTGDKARAQLAEAMRHVQASATPANLERLAEATKAMSKDQPRRSKLQNDRDAALRQFKAHVAQLARELADA